MAKKASLKFFIYFLLINFFGNTQLSLASNESDPKAKTTTTEKAITEPTSTEPTSTEPTSTEPTSTEPTSTEPTSTKAIVTESATNTNKNQDTKSAKITKAVKKVFYYSLGSVAATSSAASLIGLSLFVKNLKDIKNSYIKNFTFSLTKKAIWFFSSKPNMNKYIIPGIIFGLAANTLLSLIMSIWTFRAGYKA